MAERRKIKYSTVFWDLDGTLVNPKKRLYTFFCELTGAELSYEGYWNLKNQGYNQAGMLLQAGYKGDADIFHSIWLEGIEDKTLLEMDNLMPDAQKILEELFENGKRMVMVTNRQSYENLKWQLKNLKIDDYFDSVLTTGQRCSKDQIVVQACIEVGHAVFVGDSKEDMVAAEKLGMDSVLISEKKKDYRYTYRVKSIGELRDLLL